MNGLDFLHRDVPKLGKRVHRLGLAGTHGIDDAGMRSAIDQGMNYLYWTRPSMAPALRDAIRRDRERLVIATGPAIGHFRLTIRRAAEKALRTLGTDYIDVFQLSWAGVMSAINARTLEEMRRLKEEGKIRAIGISIHDRPRTPAPRRRSSRTSRAGTQRSWPTRRPRGGSSCARRRAGAARR